MFYYTLFVSAFLLTTQAKLPEENLPVPDLVRYWGYPHEEHKVLTEDGYYLTLHRIPSGRKYANHHGSRPVFFLQHGLLCSSSNWVTNLPEQSLGFMLADAGYDVWMGNNRGNTYSKEHVKYQVDSDEFWDFSFEQMAKYDLSATIEYALNHTGQPQLYYVGHSEGTMLIWAGLSENEELNKKIKTAFALAPVAHINGASSPIKYLSYMESEIGVFFDVIGVRDFMPSADWVKKIADICCRFDGEVCGNLLFLIAGSDQRNMNATRTPVYLTHTPAGTSVKNMLHFAQLIEAKKFQKYDYGYFKNLYHYGSFSPPAYDLTKISTKIVMFSGGNDILADPKDVRWLKSQLRTVSHHHYIPEYNHLDFIWGTSARNKVYKKIIREALKGENYNN